MPIIKLVKIEVPRPQTSFSRLVPRYEVPLWRKKWDGFIEHGQEMTVTEAPDSVGPLAFKDIPDAAYERSRLYEEFRRHRVTGDPIFDVIYPSDLFEKAYEETCIEDRAAVERDENDNYVRGYKLSDEIAAVDTPVDDLRKINGVSKSVATLLHANGLTSFKSIAEADIEDLINVKGIGIGNREAIQKSAAELAGIELVSTGGDTDTPE